MAQVEEMKKSLKKFKVSAKDGFQNQGNPIPLTPRHPGAKKSLPSPKRGPRKEIRDNPQEGRPIHRAALAEPDHPPETHRRIHRKHLLRHQVVELPQQAPGADLRQRKHHRLHGNPVPEPALLHRAQPARGLHRRLPERRPLGVGLRGRKGQHPHLGLPRERVRLLLHDPLQGREVHFAVARRQFARHGANRQSQQAGDNHLEHQRDQPGGEAEDPREAGVRLQHLVFEVLPGRAGQIGLLREGEHPVLED